MNPLLGLAVVLQCALLVEPGATAAAERRAIAYLEDEAPSWRPNNGCFSCHHDGDATRALYRAKQLGRTVNVERLERTTRWLTQPENWEHNGGEGPFSDKRLARLQFTAALVEAVRSGIVTDRGPLRAAAQALADDQTEDGSWPLEGEDQLGAPATWGRALATAQARRALMAADPERFRNAIRRAGDWLGALDPKTVPDAAAILLGLGLDEGGSARVRAIRFLRGASGPDGGWGPFAVSPPEPFDTALAILALNRAGPGEDVQALLRQGEAYLLETQLEDGSWPETTRPPGAESLAERLSTTGWVLRALLESHGPAPP